MKIERLNPGESLIAMEEWVSICPNLPELSGDYAIVRNDLNNLFESVKNDAIEKGYKLQDYYVDAQFGMSLYLYLGRQSWFNMRIAADDGFWRYLSVIVIPDIVAARWGKDNADHYWKISRRIWLKQLWWYIFLSWDSDEMSTRTIIGSSNCSTDTILNFVERSGKKGTCVDAYRQIIKLYSNIPSTKLIDFNRGRKNDDLFRIVMKLNTARMMVMEPGLCKGGNEGYAIKLFEDAGIKLNLN